MPRTSPASSPRRVCSLGAVAPVAVLASVLVGAPAARVAHAQQAPAPSTCDIDQNKPGSLGIAVLGITRVQSSTDTAAKNKSLRDVVKRVSEDQAAIKQNPVGVAFTLGQAYALLAGDLRLANSATRADLGLGGTGTQPADLLQLVDSTMTVVEQAKPGCAAQTGQLREFAWVQTTNAALQALNAQKPDSAQRLAERSLVVYKKSALPYYVLAQVAQQKNDNAKAATYWPRIIELTKGDTATQSRELRANAQFNLAAATAAAADAAPAGDAQKAKAREAADAARAFLADNAQHADAPRVQATLARMLSLTGDRAAVGAVYAEMLRDPSKYDDLALTNAGVIASQAKNPADAAKLFAAALEKNPYQRDALNNLAATYLELKQWEQMVPVAQRLATVDPANPDNPLFVAIAYQGLRDAAKTPALKKSYSDSLVKYNGQSQALPVKVTFNEFTRGETRAVLGMTVEALKPQGGAATAARGARPAARPAAGGAPKEYAFTVEFLDKAGAVIDTQQVRVGPVAPGQSKPARVESAKGGVVAFRYKLAG